LISKRFYGIAFLLVFLVLTSTAAAYLITGPVPRAVLPETHAMALVGLVLVGIAGFARKILSAGSGTKDDGNAQVSHTKHSQPPDVSQVAMARGPGDAVGSSAD